MAFRPRRGRCSPGHAAPAAGPPWLGLAVPSSWEATGFRLRKVIQPARAGARGGCGGAGSAKQLHLVPVAIPVCRLPSCQACAVKGR